MTHNRHLALEVPLQGVQLIQASAGTGKTFTLALLVARLVIEKQLTIDKILIVTFTKAATQELREKLRQQLRLAAELASHSAESLRQRESNDAARLTWPLIEAAVAREGEAALHARLQQALLDIDLAAVFTIDGFCLRILSEEALTAGQPLEPPELITSERELHEEVAYEVWRHVCQSPARAMLLPTLWPEPAMLAKQLPELLLAERLLPDQEAIAAATAPIAEEVVTVSATATPAQIEQALRLAYAEHASTAMAALTAARMGNVMNGNSYTDNTISNAWRQLATLIDAPPLSFLDTEQLIRLSAIRLMKGTKKNYAGKTPASPLFDAIDAWCTAAQILVQQRNAQRAALLHEVCSYARERIGVLKQLRRQQGFADLVAQLAQALQGTQGERLAQRLRARYPFALVDEFQDTDPKQWQIFQRLYAHGVGTNLFASASAIFLIGDPKQAIYGFRGGDVHTYLEAAQSAQNHYCLSENFRSRPSVLNAIASIFKQASTDPFAEPGIDFPTVQPGGTVLDSHFCIDGLPAPALTLCSLPNNQPDNKPINAEQARALASHACVFRIRELLAAGRSDHTQLTLKQAGVMITRGIQPGDIAVLVSNHKQAQYIQHALAEVGIASVSAGKQSLFATEQAHELLYLLKALCTPTDDRRLRTALATVLLGENALSIASLTGDETRQRDWLDSLQQWRQRWDSHGPLPMIADRVAAAGPRLLALSNGERRMSNYLQLGEALQEASAAALGPLGLTHWLARRIARSDDNDETQQLRLESDAKLVQIMTLHKSKGLEFPFVFLPFVALPPPYKKNSGLSLLRYHDGTRRITRANIELANEVMPWVQVQAVAQQEQRAEQLRLLYVALTRAQHALWLAWGPVNGTQHTALAWLLHQGQAPDSTAVEHAIDALTRGAPQAIVRQPFPDVDIGIVRLPPEPSAILPPLREITRELRRDWWVYSFSQLTREETWAEQRSADDEVRPPLSATDARFSGARFGNALHKALETITVAYWHPDSDPALPDSENSILASALRGEGYGANDVIEGVPLLARLIHATLHVRLPEGIRLSDLPPWARCNEMEFHFSFQSTRVTEIITLLHRYGIVSDRQGFGLHQRLQGLMTGKIDLIYQHQDRVYLLDYKSNYLPDYQPATLAQAMRESEYDLQYVIYALALHRWLRFRRPNDYDYDQHFGGVRYLFCRGLDAEADHSPGIYAITPPRPLIEALDSLLAPENECIT